MDGMDVMDGRMDGWMDGWMWLNVEIGTRSTRERRSKGQWMVREWIGRSEPLLPTLVQPPQRLLPRDSPVRRAHPALEPVPLLALADGLGPVAVDVVGVELKDRGEGLGDGNGGEGLFRRG
jgi:hypothetical protein